MTLAPRLCFRVRRLLTSCPKQTRRMGTRSSDRIHILGVGNLGKYVARALRRSCPELPITLIFHRPSLRENWQEAGQAVHYTREDHSDRTGGFDVEYIPDDASPVGDASPIEHLILLTKTYNTTPSLSYVKARLNEHSTILFLQNGMGNTYTRLTHFFGILNFDRDGR